MRHAKKFKVVLRPVVLSIRPVIKYHLCVLCKRVIFLFIVVLFQPTFDPKVSNSILFTLRLALHLWVFSINFYKFLYNPRNFYINQQVSWFSLQSSSHGNRLTTVTPPVTIRHSFWSISPKCHSVEFLLFFRLKSVERWSVFHHETHVLTAYVVFLIIYSHFC